MVLRVKGNNGGEVYAGSDKADGRARNGRKPGVPNTITRLIKDTALAALEKVGRPVKAYDKEGKFIGWIPTGDGGMEGYFIHVALTNETAMMGLVGKILPTQINMKTDDKPVARLRSFDEIIEIMKADGIPESMWPQRLLEPPRPDN
jgi:hypothetical protein